MKACPNCSYLWADDYSGQCLECGKPLGGVQPEGGGDLRFRYAGQVQAAQRENDLERRMKSSNGKARPGDAYDSVNLPDGIMEAARRMIVQREEVVYDE